MNIGSVFAYLKSYTNTPVLPTDLAECNGQTLSDAESPFNGQVLPNLNGTTDNDKRFLRGSTTSGTTGGAAGANHNHPVSLNNKEGNTNNIPFMTGTSNTNVPTIPPYYEVVWVIKIK
jgi:hypothetical protein